MTEKDNYPAMSTAADHDHGGGGLLQLPPFVCINLDRSTERWQRTSDEVRAAFGPDAALHRLTATDGRHRKSFEDALALVSPATRYGLRLSVTPCDSIRIDTPEAVACYHSHVRSWQWLLACPPSVQHCIVLEDDCGFAPRAAERLAEVLSLLRARGEEEGDDFDYVFLGYETMWWNRVQDLRRYIPCVSSRGEEEGPVVQKTCLGRLNQFCVDRFWGSHCYLLSRRGASRLLSVALPMELHLDKALFVLAAVGLTEG